MFSFLVISEDWKGLCVGGEVVGCYFRTASDWFRSGRRVFSFRSVLRIIFFSFG